MKKILANIRSLAIWIIAVTFFIIWAFLLIILSILLPIRIYDPVLKQGSKVFLRIIGIRRKVIGLEKFDPKTRYIFMANHTNLLDAFVVYSSFKQIGRGLEKASHFSWPIYGWALKATKMVPIPSEGGTGRTKKIYNAMRYTVEYLKKRKYLSLVILPEGTRTRTGLLGKFKRGGFLIAIETGIPIVPITVNGLFDFQQKGGFILNPGKVEVVFHEPIETKGMTKNEASTLREKVRKIIKSRHAMEIAASK